MKYRNLPHMLQSAAEERGGNTAIYYPQDGKWQKLSWLEYYDQARTIAKGLASLGLEPGEKIAILSSTRVEWTLADWGGLVAGGVPFGIYPSNMPGECKYILDNSESSFIFVENEEQLKKILEVKSDLPKLRRIVLFDGPAMADTVTLEDVIERGERESDDEIDRRLANLKPEDIATFVYTSGTTGPPKGVILTHSNVVFGAETIVSTVDLERSTESVQFLPMAHIFARLMQIIAVENDITLWYAESMEKLINCIQACRPQTLASVPRVYEKIYAKIQSGAKEAGGLKLAIFNWANRVGRRASKRIQEGKQPSPLLKLQYGLAKKLVFDKVRAAFGGRIEYAFSSAAPISIEILEFFHAAGIPILEAYGMSETTGVSNLNTPRCFKFGTVGKALSGVEVKVDDDGEVLARGPNIMPGYYRREEATRETIDPEGWIHTGDTGEIDTEGFLKITGRKKDLIITAGGKNIGPQNIENLMKTSPYISQFVAHGDRRNFLTALVTIDEEEVGKWAKEQGIAYKDYAELARDPKVRELIQGEVDARNSQLARYESIKKFEILDHDLSQEEGELTPTLKVKRNVVNKKYEGLFDSFYSEKF